MIGSMLYEKRRKSMLKPVAVITCLEDSPTSFDRRRLETYVGVLLGP